MARPRLCNERIQCEAAWPEDENHKRCEQKGVGVCYIELPRIFEEREESFPIGNDISDKHIDNERNRNQAGCKTKDHENAAAEFEHRNKDDGQAGWRQTQFRDIVIRCRDVTLVTPPS